MVMGLGTYILREIQELQYGKKFGSELGLLALLLDRIPTFTKYAKLMKTLTEGPSSAAHVSLCLTFGTLILQISLVKLSKSGPQNLKITYFWDPDSPNIARETFKIWSPKPQNRPLSGPFSGPDFERFTSEIWSFEVPKRAQNDTKV